MTILITNSSSTYSPVQSDIGKIFVLTSYSTPTFPSGWNLFEHMHETQKQVYTWIGTITATGGYFKMQTSHGVLARLD